MRPVSLIHAGHAGGAESFETAVGEEYVIPAAALPYLGRGVGLSLFDVSALARDGITGGAASRTA